MARGRAFVLGAVMGAAALAADVDVARADDLHASEGQRLYLQYCAACHGRDANGKGPVAPVLSPRPTDLAKLAQRYGTPLPKPAISEFIDGRREIRAHGSSDMPVWGRVLTEPFPPSVSEGARVRGDLMLILDYLETVQQPKKTK
ncbi:MAG TPA: cytochrome c [Myxococcota bacterium]|nr:cytochrome c [Myxococcota bacterium]